MIGSIFAAHVPLIRDYPSAPPTPPAPPAPPTPPNPPQAEPIAFSAVAKASLFGVIGTAISSTTLATITCADGGMTIVLSEAVAGLTFSYSAGILSVAGTPTGSTRRQRVVVSYIASDGSNSVRGSTSHEITLVNDSEVLTIGSQSGAAGRVGRPLSATLASPSANYNVNVTAHPAGLIPGCTAALAWTPGATSSGTLTLAGTPTRAGTLPLVVKYRSGAIEIGTSTHPVVIAEAYETQPADPSPTPSPAPPVVTAPADPAFTYQPGRGPDPLLASVIAHLPLSDESDWGKDYRGGTFVARNIGEQYPGKYYNRPLFAGADSVISGNLAGADTADGLFSAECVVSLDPGAWAKLNSRSPTDQFIPVLTYANDEGVMWSIGFMRWGDRATGSFGPFVTFAFRNNTGTPPTFGFGSGKWLYAGVGSGVNDMVLTLGMGRRYTLGTDFVSTALWADTDPGPLNGSQPAPAFGLRYRSATGVLAIGGAGGWLGNNVSIIPFAGSIQDVRITAAARFDDYLSDISPNTRPAFLPAPRRPFPWPNY